MTEPDSKLLDVCSGDLAKAQPDLLALAARLTALAAGGDDPRALAHEALAQIVRTLGADTATLSVAGEGQWQTFARVGPARPHSSDLLAEALDAEQPRFADGWLAAPLGRRSPGEVLLLSLPKPRPSADWLRAIEAVALSLGIALAIVRTRRRERRRIARLEAILQITQQWNKTNATEPLLVQMAEAATRLLGADRASIFLWDRPNRTLVGRPALGVAGGELRIPDDAGVVGQVVQTGQPQRVDVAQGGAAINRDVDRQLGYQTRSLLCVPLRGASGELFGAFELINKLDGPFGADDEAALAELAAHAAVALENTQQFEQLVARHQHLVAEAAEQSQLVGNSPAIDALRSTVRRVASTELAVVLLGENGTGKEVVSRMIHYLSPRRERPFIAVNCAAITETLLESELFGHEKGAFTDAHEARAGKFELAKGGTLFLDEIGDLSLSGQAKLLRVLEEKVVVRVGGSKPIHTDTRVIAATNQNLGEMVRQKRFRQDLFFRLNVVTLELPPLRERGDDVLLLAEHFLADFCHRAHRKPLRFSPAARSRLLAHSWPGNVRELRNAMERLAYLLPGERVEPEDLSLLGAAGEAPSAISADLALAEATDQFQIEFIRQAIERARHNMSVAAEQLGLHRSNLYRKMRQLGMPTGEAGD